MILCLPCGNVTFCWANILILFLTVSMPRSLDAFNSITPSLKDGPKSCLARHMIVVVLPTPGGPAMMMFDTLPSLQTLPVYLPSPGCQQSQERWWVDTSQSRGHFVHLLLCPSHRLLTF